MSSLPSKMNTTETTCSALQLDAMESKIEEKKKTDSSNWIPHRPEIIMETVVISTINELDAFLPILESESIKEIGCFLHLLADTGRFDKCNYVIFNVESELLVVIDLRNFHEKHEYAWGQLGKHVFSNPNIEKVFFDATNHADYLYHKHCIRLVNTVDLKVAQDCLRRKLLPCWCECEAISSTGFDEKEMEKEEQTPRRLVDLWQMYLSDSISFLEYGVMMKTYDAFGNDLQRAERKQLALEVKYLLRIYALMKQKALQEMEQLIDAKLFHS